MKQAFLDVLSQQAGFKMTHSESVRLGTCINCGESPDFTKGGKVEEGSNEYVLNAKEFRISRLCPSCFDELFSE